MCKLVTVVHQNKSLLENKVIKMLSLRQANKNDKVAIVNYGEGSIEMKLDKYDIIDYQGKIKNLKKLNYNSVFAHLPISNIAMFIELINISDLIVLTSQNIVMSLNDFSDINFKNESVLEKTTVIFQQ